MLSTRTLAVPTTCRRCQLLEVIYQTRIAFSSRCLRTPTRHQSRCITVTTGRGEDSTEEGEQLLDDASRTDKKSRISKYPLGRIVGKHGRRQRESSARLGTDAMKKPFEVILMKDVPEPREEAATSETDIAFPPSNEREAEKRHIPSNILQSEEPSQTEVELSIDSLRPETTILDDTQYYELAKGLSESYNPKQLSLYLTKSLKLSSPELAEVNITLKKALGRQRKGRFQGSSWRPGRTPLQQRPAVKFVVNKRYTGTTKTKLVEQILRSAWRLGVHSEMQQIGELEIQLPGWQISYLFDLSNAGMPMYEAMIDSALLRRNSEVRPYRPDCVMRITARRQDAMDIADQVLKKLQDTASLTVDLGVFRGMLGRLGWPNRFEQLFDEATLSDVGQRTSTVTEWSDFKTLVIHGETKDSVLNARRLLLSNLALPSPQSIETTDAISATVGDHNAEGPNRPLLLPTHSTSNLPLHYRHLTLGRLLLPTGIVTKSPYMADGADQTSNGEAMDQHMAETESAFKTQVHSLTSRLFRKQPYNTVAESAPIHSNSYWNGQANIQPLPWMVQFDDILHPAAPALDMTSPARIAAKRRKSKVPDLNALTDGSKQSIVQSQFPGLTDLLSYFSPRYERPHNPALVAHFMPSPLNGPNGVAAMATLPRIEIRYGFHDSMSYLDPEDIRGVRLMSIRAALTEQELRVPLPHQTTDLCFRRRVPLSARTSLAAEDAQIRKFTQTLVSSFIRGQGALEGEPTVVFSLPRWLVHSSTIDLKEVEVEYLFEKFEQVQSVQFIPRRDDEALKGIDPMTKKLLDVMPEYSFLNYREIDGGTNGGRRTELMLKYDSFRRQATSRIGETQQTESETIDPEVDEADSPPSMKPDVVKQRNWRLVETGLRIADALTRINAGELKALRGS